MTQDGGGPPDLRQMARDWITIWQSELNAAATDRELLDGFTRMVDQWAQAAQAAAALLPGPPCVTGHPRQATPDAANGRAGPGAPSGAAAAAAAPDACELASQRRTIEQLAERVAELERLLAGHAGGSTDVGTREFGGH